MSESSSQESLGFGEFPSKLAVSSSQEFLTEEQEPEPVKNLTIKFRVGSDVFTQSYPENMSILDVKMAVADICAVFPANIVLTYKESELSNEQFLSELKCDCYGVIELLLSSLDPDTKISIDSVYKDVGVVPDILTVKVQTEDRGIIDVTVEVEDRRIKKPFLGGYLDTSSEIEYHHGYTQTGPLPPKVPPHLLNHRDTQTYFVRNRKQQMSYSRATQMHSRDIWIPNVTDRILVAKPYETAEEREKRIDIEGKVRTIQRYYRAWKMRKALKELSAEYHKRVQKELEAEELEKKMDADRRREELICKIFPYNLKDFSMLYAMLERWKKNEIERINSSLCGPARIAEFYMLLDKEIDMIQTIEKLYQKTREDRKLQEDMNFFKMIGTPLDWNSDYKNLYIQMDTLETQKGREYHEMYDKFVDRTYTREERLSILLDVKAMIGNHHCEITLELNDLINRACDLLTRDIEMKILDNLQKRMESLLLQHIKTPTCNEGVTNRPRRVKEKLMENNLYFCQRCQKLKTMESFALNARMNKIRICNMCNAIDKSSEVWVDLAPYNFILKQIRRTEMMNRAASSVVFILQGKDIYHLITVIWHLHSALSECTDIYQLRLCRWYKDQNWSPWNCILLTTDEVKAHLKVEDLEAVYEQEFINHVFNKHALARKHFAHLSDVDEMIAENSRKDWRLDGTKSYKKFVALSTNLRESIESWNLGTNSWLRFIVYDRVQKYRTVLTYTLSAIWHGFYPGYYITFANGALFTFAARSVRRTLRSHFVNSEHKLLYDVVTFIATRLVMAYITFTFILLEFWPSIRVYVHMYWCLHVLALLVIFVLPKLVPPNSSPKTSKHTLANAISQAGSIGSGVSRHHD